jgi:predicted transcriptional regulator
MFPLTSGKKVSTDVRIESVGHNFARLLSRLEDPRLSIFLSLLTRSYLTREALEKELKFSPDIMKRALTWLLREGFISRIYLYEHGARVVGYHIIGTANTVTLPVGDGVLLVDIGASIARDHALMIQTGRERRQGG